MKGKKKKSIRLRLVELLIFFFPLFFNLPINRSEECSTIVVTCKIFLFFSRTHKQFTKIQRIYIKIHRTHYIVIHKEFTSSRPKISSNN